jgi:hypothetical protein
LLIVILGTIVILLISILSQLVVGFRRGYLKPIIGASLLQQADSLSILFMHANGDCWIRPLTPPEIRSGSLGGPAIFIGNFWSSPPKGR